MRTSRPGQSLLKVMRVTLLIVLTLAQSFGAVLNVPGTYATIQAAANVMNPDDVIRVAAGTYNEQPTLSRSGSLGHRIYIVADGAVICRGFALSGVTDISIIGFEITHLNSTFNDGVMLGGACNRIEIIDNNMHNLHSTHSMIGVVAGGTPGYVTVRGNTFDQPGIVGGVGIEDPGVAVGNIYITPHHWLVEYNKITRVGDFINVYGTNHVVRNNSMTNHTSADWGAPWNSTPFHSDGFQPGSDTATVGTRLHVYENNWHGYIFTEDGHFGLWQDTVAAGDTDIIIRGNVSFRVGSGGIGVISTDHVASYNNTFSELCYLLAGPSNGLVVNFYSGGGHQPNYPSIHNTLIYDNGNRTAIDGTDATNFRAGNNLGYQAGSHASYTSTSNPNFVDRANENFRLQGGSPAINGGTYLTTVSSATGSGTSFNVTHPWMFTDGKGLVTGDTITIAGQTRTLTAISGSTYTVNASLSWTLGDGVYWGSDSTPDIGALPSGSAALTGATISNVGTTYTVTPTGDCRGVWFYVDGIPTIWDETPPFSATIASGVVTAKAYPLYAQPTVFFTATAGGGGGGAPASGKSTMRRRKLAMDETKPGILTAADLAALPEKSYPDGAQGGSN